MLSALTKEEITSVLSVPEPKRKPTPVHFVNLLKQNAIITDNVLWNGQELKELELTENLERIKELNIKSIQRGYDCSACDPFLLLICQLFHVKIHHKFHRVMMKYYPKDTNEKTKIINFGSNKGHFWTGNRQR